MVITQNSVTLFHVTYDLLDNAKLYLNKITLSEEK